MRAGRASASSTSWTLAGRDTSLHLATQVDSAESCARGGGGPRCAPRHVDGVQERDAGVLYRDYHSLARCLVAPFRSPRLSVAQAAMCLRSSPSSAPRGGDREGRARGDRTNCCTSRGADGGEESDCIEGMRRIKEVSPQATVGLRSWASARAPPLVALFIARGRDRQRRARGARRRSDRTNGCTSLGAEISSKQSDASLEQQRDRNVELHISYHLRYPSVIQAPELRSHTMPFGARPLGRFALAEEAFSFTACVIRLFDTRSSKVGGLDMYLMSKVPFPLHFVTSAAY